MSDPIFSRGNAVTQTVSFVFPDGDISPLTKGGMKLLNAVSGAGIAGKLQAVGMSAAKALHGGMPYPGKVSIFKDKFVFEPSFAFLSSMYQGVNRIEIELTDIRSAASQTKKFILRYCVITLKNGAEFKILAPIDAGAIAQALNARIK